MTKEIEKPEVEVIESNEIDAEVGDVVDIDGELFDVEEDTGSDKDAEKSEPKLDENGEPIQEEIVGDEPAIKSEKVTSDEVDDMRIKIFERKIKSQEKLIKEATLTPEQIRQRVPLATLKTNLPIERALLNEIDKDDNPEEYRKQLRIVSQLETDITDKEQTARLDERFNSKDNRIFLVNERKAMADKGTVFSDTQWDTIAEVAEEYLDDGKYTKESIQKSLIDILGADAAGKLVEVTSEQKLRKDIKTAAAKVTKSVRVTRSGVNAKLVPFSKRLLAITDADVLDKELSKLSPEQFAMYEKELAKKT